MNKKLVVGIVIGVLVVAGLAAALWLAPNTTTAPAAESNTSQTETDDAAQESSEASIASGRYISYDPELVSVEGYNETILFFHASWCPECRAFESAIEASTIPDGVQILKVNYDTATDLRQQYGVTLQSTFVLIDDEGNELSQWVGYKKEKSVEAILENT